MVQKLWRVTKREAIISIRNRAERDPAISDGALRLIMRLCSTLYPDPKVTLDTPFPLPWSKVAEWCFLNHKRDAYRRTAELLEEGYLKCDGLRGCPPIQHFFLTPNGSQKAPIKGSQKAPIKCDRKAPINRGQKPPHHKYNSFQEERLKERGEELAGCAGKKRSGAELASPPAATKGLTSAERSAEVARLRKELEQ